MDQIGEEKKKEHATRYNDTPHIQYQLQADNTQREAGLIAIYMVSLLMLHRFPVPEGNQLARELLNIYIFYSPYEP